MKEIIIEMPETKGEKYRLKWTFGKKYPYLSWWCDIEREVERKRLFRKSAKRWEVVNSRWVDRSIDTYDDLEKIGKNLFYDEVEFPYEEIQKAMKINQPTP